ncbi:MAG: hypothetical protein Q4E22_06500, partial [Coriobacteriia bacterium]|nr:hypothetical protein [Coriobacteriia bacterium]
MKSESYSSFIFDVESSEVEIGTYTKAILEHAEMIKRSSYLLYGSKETNVSIKANRPGSLEVIFSYIEGPTIIAAMIGAGAILIQTIVEFYQSKKDAQENGGAKTIEVNNKVTKIKFNNGKIINYTVNINQLIEDEEINKSSERLFKTLQSDTKVRGISIKDERSGIVLEREEFPEMMKPITVQDDINNTKTEVCRYNLQVIRPYLSESLPKAWEFLRFKDQSSINAKIVDDDFLNNITKYSFTVGTIMDVDLEITSEYDEYLQEYLEKKYKITKVHEVKERA